MKDVIFRLKNSGFPYQMARFFLTLATPVQLELLDSEDLPEGFFLGISSYLDRLSVETTVKLASIKYAGEKTLTALSVHKNDEVRLAVAKNSNTPRDTLLSLAMNSNTSIKNAIKANPSSDSEIRRLADFQTEYFLIDQSVYPEVIEMSASDLKSSVNKIGVSVKLFTEYVNPTIGTALACSMPNGKLKVLKSNLDSTG